MRSVPGELKRQTGADRTLNGDQQCGHCSSCSVSMSRMQHSCHQWQACAMQSQTALIGSEPARVCRHSGLGLKAASLHRAPFWFFVMTAGRQQHRMHAHSTPLITWSQCQEKARLYGQAVTMPHDGQSSAGCSAGTNATCTGVRVWCACTRCLTSMVSAACLFLNKAVHRQGPKVNWIKLEHCRQGAYPKVSLHARCRKQHLPLRGQGQACTPGQVGISDAEASSKPLRVSIRV